MQGYILTYSKLQTKTVMLWVLIREDINVYVLQYPHCVMDGRIGERARRGRGGGAR